MTSPWSAAREGAPIDAEFETTAAGGARAKPRARPAASPKRSRSITLLELVGGCIAATIAGAAMAIAVVGSGSGVSTGPLAIDVGMLKRRAADIAARNEQAMQDIAALRARLDAGADRIAARETAELGLREELATLTAQMSALAGAAPAGQAAGGASAGMSPLGSLIGRMDRLEGQLAADATQPQTGPQMQRALKDLADRLAGLDAANATLAETLNQRTATIASLQAGLADASAQLVALRPQAGRMTVAAVGDLPAPQPRIAEALARLEETARRGVPFASQQGQLASLAPLDPDIAALATIARSGAPNAEQLRRQFEAIAGPIEAEVQGRTGDDGLNWLRTAGTGVALERSDSLAPITAARTALSAAHLTAAAAAPLPPAFAAWRDAVRRRLRLDALLARLHAR